MKLSFDKFERYELPQVTLCNPNSRAKEVDGEIMITDTVGVLSNPKGMNLKLNFNAPHELSFDYYRHKSNNRIKQSFYDSIYEAIQTYRYVYLTDIGYFVISSATDSDKDNIDKKSISLKSCEENELATAKGLYLKEGTYYLHTDNNDGLLDLFLPKTVGWTIGYIEPSLLTKPYFVEDTEVDNGYNFLYTTVQDMFECIVEPDIIKRTISIYSREYYAEHHLTDIHIAKYNLLKHRTVEENDEDKYTVLNVRGKDENLEIHTVNPTGKNYIVNFEPRYSWMSPALQQAVEKWQEKCESVEEEYLELQKGYYYELDLLFNEEQDIKVLKKELKELKATKDLNMSGDYDKTQYKTQELALKAINDLISEKQNDIKEKTSDYNIHKLEVQTTYEEPINKINTDCTLSTSIESFAMESGTIKSTDGQPGKNKKRIRTTNFTILDAGTYSISNAQNFPIVLYVYDSENNYLSELSITSWSSSPLTFTLDSQYKIKFAMKKSDTDEITVSDVSGIKISKTTGSFAIDVDGHTLFTESLLNELMTHFKPTDYIDEYMFVTESMTNSERFEKAKELMSRAQSQLVKISSGKKTYSIDTRSFLFNKQFRHFSEQLCAGAIIYTEIKNDLMEQLHLTGIDINFDEKSTNFTLGNKYDRSDLKALYDDALGQNSKSFSELKYIASIVEDQKKYYKRDWAAELRTLTLDNVLTSEDQAFEINNRGLIGRKRQINEDGTWETDENENPLFDAEQVKLVHNTLIFTEDNWDTASTAVGKIAVGKDSEDNVIYRYGINGQVLIGELILGNNLVLTGTGAGIKITDSNGNNAFYADDNGNLVLSGTVFAESGEMAGWKIKNNTIFSTDPSEDYGFYLSSWNGDSDNWIRAKDDKGNYNFRVSKNGYLYAEGANIKGIVIAKEGEIGGWSITETSIYSDEEISGTTNKHGFYLSGLNSDSKNWIRTYDENGYFTFGVNKGNGGVYFGDNSLILAYDNTGVDTTDSNFKRTIWKHIDYNSESNNGLGGAAFKMLGNDYIRINTSSSYIDLNGTDITLHGTVSELAATSTDSDANVKNSIDLIHDKYDLFYDNIVPRIYKYNNGTSNRYHTGFIYQEIEDAQNVAELSETDLAVLVNISTTDEDGNAINRKTVRYDEFIALNTWQIQKLKSRVLELEKRLKFVEQN